MRVMDAPRLDPDRIETTVEFLSSRIEERFPGSGLSEVCGQLLETTRRARERVAWIARPIAALRVGIALLVALIAAGLFATIASLEAPKEGIDFITFVQAVEAGINDVVLVGAALFFLVTIESRAKRRRGLAAIHELRAIAHIIDMHQLTKDPEQLISEAGQTSASPERRMSTIELGRYLDYCSEMLALTGKVAALYIQGFDDAVAIAAVNEVEDLTTGLSRKIWQKLMVLHTADR